jgi:hypothetical protein
MGKDNFVPEETVCLVDAAKKGIHSAQLASAISELQGLHKVLQCEDLDPRILETFRHTLNRVRNAAWAAQQYLHGKETGQEAGSIFSLIAGERIRAAFHLCEAISADLKTDDLDFQTGSLIQLHTSMNSLTEQLEKIIKARGL